MEKEEYHVKTFELNTDWKSIRKSWDMLLRDTLDLDKTRKEFLRSYLPPALGKELNIKEAKGVKCVRVYYDEKDNALFIEIYDKTGYIDFELNLEYPETENAGPEDEEEDIEELLENFRRVYDVFDARKAISQASPGAQEVVIHKNQCTWHFKKIPAYRYDIYMQDPVWLIDTITSVVGRFYDLGYKLTEYTRTHVDGIIASSRRFYYNSKGVLLKKIFMCGTPWGGIADYEEEHWNYNCQENTATMKEINVRNDVVMRLFQYKLDEQGRIRERKDFMYPREEMIFSTKAGTTDRLLHSRTLIYAYGQNDKLCEIKPVFCVPTRGFARIVYEYDNQGRLVSQRDYNDKDEIIVEDTYKYTDDGKVQVTCRVFTYPPAGPTESKDQT